MMVMIKMMMVMTMKMMMIMMVMILIMMMMMMMMVMMMMSSQQLFVIYISCLSPLCFKQLNKVLHCIIELKLIFEKSRYSK